MQNKGRFSHILWDWNGTLLCDISASLGSVNDMLARRGRPAMELAAYYGFISTPIRGFYEAVFDLEQEAYEAILREYNAGYERRLAACGLTPGVEAVLQAARAKGIRQCIVSSCEQNLLRRSLERFAVSGCFDAVLGSRDYLAGSKLVRAKAYLASCPACDRRPLVIGDLAQDAILAAQLDADCILLTGGHHSRAQYITQIPPESAQPVILDNAADVIQFLQ